MGGSREGSGWGGGVRVGVIEELKFSGKFKKKIGGGVGSGGGGVRVGGVQGGCERRIEIFGKINTKKIRGGGGRVGGGGQGECE